MWRFGWVLLLALGTVGAWMGSAYGWGLDSPEDQPVSIRQDSAHGPRMLYFIGTGRHHAGGGYRGGK